MSETRERIVSSMTKLCLDAGFDMKLEELTNQQFKTFILDPSSLYLKNRVNINHPVLPLLFQLSRDFCYAIDRSRVKTLL